MLSQVVYGSTGERRIFSKGSYITILNHAYMQWRGEGHTSRTSEEEKNRLLGAELVMGGVLVCSGCYNKIPQAE